MRDLPPVLEPLTHIPAYTAGEPSTLAYYERTRSQNRSYGSSGSTGGTKSHKINLTANDTNGSVTDSPIFHIQKDTSAPTKSVVQICDMEGKTLLSVEREFSAVSWKPPMRIVDAKGEVILDMKWHKKFQGMKITTTFTRQDGRTSKLKLKGNAHWTKAEIRDMSQKGVIVARLQRKFLDALSRTWEFSIQVAPGVDMALMVAMSFVWTALITGW